MKWPNAGAGSHGGRKPSDPSIRGRCWFHIPIGCTAAPEFVVTLAQAKSRAGFQSEQGGKPKGIRRYLCRAHLSLFQRPLVELTRLRHVKFRAELAASEPQSPLSAEGSADQGVAFGITRQYTQPELKLR